MKKEQHTELLIEKEIELTRLFYSMIKDTKDQLEEYFKLNNYNETDKKNCLKIFIQNLEKALKLPELSDKEADFCIKENNSNTRGQST